ncbi:MAG: hypothetical protein ACOYWZ_14765 [Bacillota bacterium]
MSITDLSKQSGIPMTTLNGWKIRALKKMNNNKNINFNKKTMTSSDKFHIIMETYTLSEYDLAQYCRKNGLYVDEVKKWRSDLESSIAKEPDAVKEVKEELTEEKKKNRLHEKELNRKGIGRSSCITCTSKKVLDVHGGKGRLITLCERKRIVDMISEARRNGARLKQACKVVDFY